MFNAEKTKRIRSLNKATRYATENRIALKNPKFDTETLRLVGFSNASFVNNAHPSTKLGHICFLADEQGSSVPIDFKSYKSKRVVRSAMEGEVVAFSDLLDIVAILASELGELLQRKQSVQLLTD